MVQMCNGDRCSVCECMTVCVCGPLAFLGRLHPEVTEPLSNFVTLQSVSHVTEIAVYLHLLIK